MPAYFDTGFCVRRPSWHGQENLLQEYPENWDAAREAAGLTWEPETRPVYAFDGDLDSAKLRVMAAAEGMSEESESDALRALADSIQLVPGRQRIVRSDTGATLGIPTSSYQVITHGEIGEIVEALLEQPNVKYETAGSVSGGQQVYALAYLDEPINLPNDPSITLPYLGITCRHDGTGALRAQSTSVRIVCANTFSAAEAEADRNATGFSFSHKGSWRDRIEEARKVIQGVRDDFARYADLMGELASAPVTQEQTERFIAEFIPSPPEGLISKRVQNNVDAARDNMRLILAGPTSEGISGTAYGLVQAAGEYLDHYRAYRTHDSYFRRQLLAPEKLKSKAVELARDVLAHA